MTSNSDLTYPEDSVFTDPVDVAKYVDSLKKLVKMNGNVLEEVSVCLWCTCSFHSQNMLIMGFVVFISLVGLMV